MVRTNAIDGSVFLLSIIDNYGPKVAGMALGYYAKPQPGYWEWDDINNDKCVVARELAAELWKISMEKKE